MEQGAETRKVAVSRYAVLYRERPAWLVPDGCEGSGLPYPGDYAGVVIAARPEGHAWGPGDLADARRKLVALELTPDEVGRLRSRELKIAGGKPAEVNFNDRWGAVAPALRARFVEAEIAEEKARMGAARAPGDHGPDPSAEGEGEEFDRAAASLMMALPKVIVHSGAGLYEVGPGKTYSTIQSALDQLWTDQGSSTFTAGQYIRIFAGTYAESVTPNAALDPDEAGAFGLIIEGDPADSRDNIIIAPSSGTDAVYVNCDHVLLRHLKVAGAPTTYSVRSGSGNHSCMVFDCEIASGVNVAAVYAWNDLWMENCSLVVTSNAAGAQTAYGEARVADCKIVGPGSGSSTKPGVYTQRFGFQVSGTVVSGFQEAVSSGAAPSYIKTTSLRNCTFHDCDYGVRLIRVLGIRLAVINTIFKTVAYPYYPSAWPEETATVLGAAITQRNNCYHGYTAFAYDGSDTKTCAEWTALNQVDASGELDATDPLLTDPGSGDFSLQAASPCRHAGHGSGVTAGHLATTFDPNHPDIGAWSSGAVATPGRPSASISSVQDTAITVTVDGDADVENEAELIRASTGEVVDSASRDGDGDVELTAPEVPARYYVVVSSKGDGERRSLPSAPCESCIATGESPHEAARLKIVSLLRSHSGLAEVLGTDEGGNVPIYAAHPGASRRLPCVVYTLEGCPDAALGSPGRWEMRLALEAWGGSPGTNDQIVMALAEVLMAGHIEAPPWRLKRFFPTRDTARWTDDGRTEIRRSAWTFVVDYTGS